MDPATLALARKPDHPTLYPRSRQVRRASTFATATGGVPAAGLSGAARQLNLGTGEVETKLSFVASPLNCLNAVAEFDLYLSPGSIPALNQTNAVRVSFTVSGGRFYIYNNRAGLMEGWQRVSVPISGLGTQSGSPLASQLSAVTAVAVFANGSIGPYAIVDNLRIVSATRGSGVIVNTFDDALVSNYTKAFPKMESLGFVGTCYVIKGNVLSGGTTIAQYHEMQNAGWDVASHGPSVLTGMTPSQLRAEFSEIHTFLRENGFKQPRHYAYPGGAFNETVRSIAAEYFDTAVTISNRYSSGENIVGLEAMPVADPLRIRRLLPSGTTQTLADLKGVVDDAMAARQLLVFGWHGIHDSIPSNVTVLTTTFNDLMDYISAQGYPVMSMSELWAA